MEKYKFRPFKKNFSLLYKKEESKLKKILNKSAHIEHIGSSAVNGLGGKGLIDIIIGVSRKAVIPTKRNLEKAGYEFRPNAGDKNRLFFMKDYTTGGKPEEFTYILPFT